LKKNFKSSKFKIYKFKKLRKKKDHTMYLLGFVCGGDDEEDVEVAEAAAAAAGRFCLSIG